MTKNIICLLCEKFLVKKFFLYIITVKLDFDIDIKFANSDFKNPKNTSVDNKIYIVIITKLSTFLFLYEPVMNFSWNPKDSHN